MEVKTGYQQTDVGVIPAEWKVLPVQEVANVKTGPFGSTLHERDYVRDGTPIITVEHLSEYGVVHSNLPMVSDSDKQRLKAYSLEENDIVFSRVGSVDRNSLINKKEAGWLFSGRLLRVRPNYKEIYSPFLSYQFLSETFKQRIRSVAVGQTMASLNTQILNGIIIIQPPVPEQRAIATVLSDVDTLITSLDQIIAKKRDIKQAAMQELLTGKRRLPGFNWEWEIKRLGEIGECIIGLTYSPNNVNSSGLLVLRASNIANNGLKFDDNVFVDVNIPEKLYVRKDDILICVRSGSRDLIGKCALIDEKAEGMTFGAFMSIFRTQYSHFVFYQFQSDLVKKQIYENIGATINQITNKNLTSFQIPFPKDEREQTAIATVLIDMDAELTALEQQRDKTKAIKQGMMQELLTGRIRLT